MHQVNHGEGKHTVATFAGTKFRQEYNVKNGSHWLKSRYQKSCSNSNDRNVCCALPYTVNSPYQILCVIAGIATLVFNTRLGLYEDQPPQLALKFTEVVNNFFELSHKLLFNPLSRIARQYFDPPTFKKFLENADAFMETGQGIVDKKTRELTEMTEKGIDLGDAQGL